MINLMKKLIWIFTFVLLMSAAAYAQDSAEIVGGTDAPPDAYPWMVAVGNPFENGFYQFCGGSLIHPEWVLTAAHCIVGETPSGLQVVIGLHDLRNSATEGVRRGVTQIITHPNYHPLTANYDITLLKLSAPVDDVPLLLPAFSADEDLNAPGNITTAMGWGALQSGGAYPDILQHVELPLVSNATCNEPQSYNGAITEQMLCAGYPDGGKDSCQGDSGGPLVVKDAEDRWRQVGIVSWGNGCAFANYYGVYARVSVLADWIQTYTGSLEEEPTPAEFKQFMPVVFK